MPYEYEDWLRDMCRETARMAYSARMSGSVRAETKAALADYFTGDFQRRLAILGETASVARYQKWHGTTVKGVGNMLVKRNLLRDLENRFGVSAKLLDTFMHQLMKYDMWRAVRPVLYLPLDMLLINYPPQKKLPYSIKDKDYYKLQEILWEIIRNLSRRLRIKSRVDLNCMLWDNSGEQIADIIELLASAWEKSRRRNRK